MLQLYSKGNRRNISARSTASSFYLSRNKHVLRYIEISALSYKISAACPIDL
ncbi:hypothetical protein WH47_01332 [Habropoda laboriosa]|uniref:Uncharacterized protein n=1 Tax=Habropoda laboriosa TaxID=597456 RepID=A0A0L7R2S9_9HYME|nr:hypothetical protein WH47_01332 [Habropoda laboriosa]